MKIQFHGNRATSWAPAIVGAAFALMIVQPLPLSAKTMTDGIHVGKSPQGYSYVSGGVGIEERNRILKHAHDYDLELSFADNAGHYLSDVDVTIRDKNGNSVVDTSTAGPLFFIDLPAGKYDVQANYDNKTEEIKNVPIAKGRLMTRLLHWNLAAQTISQR